MPKKYKINSNPCKYCNGKISWDEKIDGSRPTHVDENGRKLNDGECPKFRRNQGSNSRSTSVNHKFLFNRPKFHKFGKTENNLRIFKDKIPHATRYLIGKIERNLTVDIKLIKIKDLQRNDSIFKFAHNIIRGLLEEYSIVSFFEIQKNLRDDSQKDSIYFYLLNSTLNNNALINFISKKILRCAVLVNEELKKKIDAREHKSSINHLFNGIIYQINESYYRKKYNPKTALTNEVREDHILVYVDLDVKYGSTETEPAGKFYEGNRVFGKDHNDRNKKYFLKEITDVPVTSSLKTNEYKKEFVPYVREMFFNEGLSKKKEDGSNWTVFDLWEKVFQKPVSQQDRIARLSTVQSSRAKTLLFPSSRLFLFENYIPTKQERINNLHEICKDLVSVLNKAKEQIESLNVPLEIIPLHEVIPKYFDLMEWPLIVEFANGKELELKRKLGIPKYLNDIPQEFMKRTSGFQPISGKFDFQLVLLAPDDLSEKEKSYFKSLLEEIKRNMTIYKIASDVRISPTINYTWNKNDIIENRRNLWAQSFENEIKPELIKISNSIKNTKKIVIVFLGLRDLRTASLIFKREMQNHFYECLQRKLISSNHFSYIQGLKYDHKPYQDKAQKVPMMAYCTALQNLASNNPNSEIAQKIKQGIIFTLKYPFGTKDINKIEERISMIGGFDASRAEHAESTEPRGATITIIDPLGRQIETGYVENARTHSGVITERSVREIIINALSIQEKILKESYPKNKNPIPGTLDEFLYNNPDLPKRIYFVYDGNLLRAQINSFVTIYEELSQANKSLPEIYLFEDLKSHPFRNFLESGREIENIPFGVLALLNERDMYITNHILQRKKLMKKGVFVSFKMRLSTETPQLITYNIEEDELVQIGVQLFQTTIFNTGKSGRPLKEFKVIHESHKLAKEFGELPAAPGVLHYKE